jgi:hypothetical protein
MDNPASSFFTVLRSFKLLSKLNAGTKFSALSHAEIPDLPPLINCAELSPGLQSDE